jgi:RNA recognition motif-containing protein
MGAVSVPIASKRACWAKNAAPVYSSWRNFMEKKLFVGNLAYSVTETQLQELFERQGTVKSAKVISDKSTGRSRGYGFVEMSSDEEARRAIDALNGMQFEGRTLIVNEAHPQETRLPGTPQRHGLVPFASSKGYSKKPVLHKHPKTR